VFVVPLVPVIVVLVSVTFPVVAALIAAPSRRRS
jgi:hypothetical protein